MLHLGMGFYKFLHPMSSWFLYIDPTVAQDVKKKNVILFLSLLSLTLLSLLTLSSLFLFLSLSVDLVVLGVDFGGCGLNRWSGFESVAKPWVSSRWFWRRWALVSGLGLESVALGFGFRCGT